jgi:O-methyltransferase
MILETAGRVSCNDMKRLRGLHAQALLRAGDGADFIELGVYRGGSALLLAHALDTAPRERRVHLIDNWRGLPRLGPQDAGCVVRAGTFAGVHESECAELLRAHGLGHRVTLHAGDLAAKLEECPGPFALAHVDVDLYAGTRAALLYLLPRMTRDGVIVVDDYGSQQARNFPGVERAVSEVLGEVEGWEVAYTIGDRDQAAVLVRKA